MQLNLPDETPEEPAQAEGGDAQPRNIDALLRQYRPLVMHIVRRVRMRLPAGVDADELVQAGMIGLHQAATNFVDGGQCRFATYASRRIEGAVLDVLRSTDPCTRTQRATLRRAAAASATVAHETTARPGRAEIARQAGITIQALDGVELAPRIERIDDAHDIACPRDTPDQWLVRKRQCEDLVQAIVKLPEPERAVLSMLYDDALTGTEVARRLRLSNARISQIHGSALKRLKQRMHARGWIGEPAHAVL